MYHWSLADTDSLVMMHIILYGVGQHFIAVYKRFTSFAIKEEETISLMAVLMMTLYVMVVEENFIPRDQWVKVDNLAR